MAGIVQKGSTKYRLNNKELEAFNAATNEWYRITTLLNPKELILQDGKLGYIGTDGKTYLENWDGTGFAPEKETSKREKKQKKQKENKEKKKRGCLWWLCSPVKLLWWLLVKLPIKLIKMGERNM